MIGGQMVNIEEKVDLDANAKALKKEKSWKKRFWLVLR